MSDNTEMWDLWYPKGGPTGIPFARGRIASGAQIMLVHAAPDILTVDVMQGNGKVLATGKDLERNADTPMCRLTRQGKRITREDIWPGKEDLDHLVILPGGEVGTLKQWWHADDHSEWRWQLELYNCKE